MPLHRRINGRQTGRSRPDSCASCKSAPGSSSILAPDASFSTIWGPIGRSGDGRCISRKSEPRPRRRLSCRDTIQGRANLAEPLDRLEVERVAEDEDDLGDPDVAAYPRRSRRRPPASRRPSGRGRCRRSPCDPRDRGGRRSRPTTASARRRRVADDEMPRHGPLDRLERPADLLAALVAGRPTVCGDPLAARRSRSTGPRASGRPQRLSRPGAADQDRQPSLDGRGRHRASLSS